MGVMGALSCIRSASPRLQPAFDLPHEGGGDETERKEEQADERDRLEISEGLGADVLGRLHHFENGDPRQQRRLLEKGDQVVAEGRPDGRNRSDEDTSEPQSLMRNSYA